MAKLPGPENAILRGEYCIYPYKYYTVLWRRFFHVANVAFSKSPSSNKSKISNPKAVEIRQKIPKFIFIFSLGPKRLRHFLRKIGNSNFAKFGGKKLIKSNPAFCPAAGLELGPRSN